MNTAVTMANGDSTRAIGVGEAMIPVVGHGIALQSLLVPGLRAGLIAAGQVAKQHDILIQKQHMFVVPRGPPSATKLIHSRGTKVRRVYRLDIAQPHTVHAVARIPARGQALHRTFSHADANSLRLIDRPHPTTGASLDKRLCSQRAQTFQSHSATLSPLGSSPAAPLPNGFIPTMLRSRSAPPLEPTYMPKVHQ
jgi:hypothetical protein